MPDRDYYLSKDARIADTRAKYLQHLTNVLTLAGEVMPRPARRRSSIREEGREGPLDHSRKPRRDQDLQQDERRPASEARSGFDFRAFMNGVGHQAGRAARRAAERDRERRAHRRRRSRC